MSHSNVTVLVYGPPGVGKTTFAASGGRPTFVLDVERGALSVRHLPGVEVLDVGPGAPTPPEVTVAAGRDSRSFRLVEYVATTLSRRCPNSVIVVDSVSVLAEWIRAELAEQRARDPLRIAPDDYGAASEAIGRLLWGALKGHRGVVVLTALDDRDPTGVMRPALNPALLRKVSAAADVIAPLVVGEDGARALLLGPSPRYVSKVRAPAGVEIRPVLERPTLKDLLTILQIDGKEDSSHGV